MPPPHTLQVITGRAIGRPLQESRRFGFAGLLMFILLAALLAMPAAGDPALLSFGGDKGYYLVHSNVDGAAVYFNGDSFVGYIENGTLLVTTCTTCTPVRTFTVEKCGYFSLTQNNTRYPAKDETVDLYANLTAPKEPLIWDFTANVTEGTAPLKVGFASSGIGVAQAWNWSFGDGTYSGEKDPVHIYEGGGVYTVSLQVSNSACQDSSVVKEDYISVEGPPLFKADFTVSPVTGIVPLTVHCTDHSAGNPTTIVYNFGDGFTATGGDVVHTYRLPGTYTITETISKYDTATRVFLKSVARKPDAITVLAKPIPLLAAAFSASPESGMKPLKVTFTDESIGNPTYYSYDFGDGFTSSSKNPVHTYQFPGVYEVKLTVLKVNTDTSSLQSSDATGTIVVTGHR
jgi:PKD repeat protein